MQKLASSYATELKPDASTVDDDRVDQSREWLFAGADEWFRKIYTRAIGTAEVVAVCSAIEGEGKTTISIGLAATLAEDFPERRFMLVETDLSNPILNTDFGLEDGPGLANCLEGSRHWQEACRATALPNLDLLPAGTPTVQGGRLLRSRRMPLLLDSLRESYDAVIVDAPALLPNSDAQLIADVADGTIMVVRAGITPAPLVDKALEQIDQSKMRGIVLNGTRSRLPRWMRRITGV